MTAIRVIHPNPDVKRGVEYWEGVDATVDGVLGGFGHVSRMDTLGSRTFLLKVLPHLSYCPATSISTSPFQWKKEQVEARGGKGKAVTRALDCGAGVGRVTENTLLPLFDEVHLVEPVAKFLEEAKKNTSKWKPLTTPPSQSPFQARKAAHFHCSTLQDFDPSRPYASSSVDLDVSVSVDDEQPTSSSLVEAGIMDKNQDGQQLPLLYDVVWCQWCLQHLSDKDLVAFLKRSRQSLKDKGVIVVKENVCSEEQDGSERVWYDDEDHSITRSTKAYERVFAEAGLEVVRLEVQHGLPDELFVVKMWALC